MILVVPATYCMSALKHECLYSLVVRFKVKLNGIYSNQVNAHRLLTDPNHCQTRDPVLFPLSDSIIFYCLWTCRNSLWRFTSLALRALSLFPSRHKNTRLSPVYVSHVTSVCEIFFLCVWESRRSKTPKSSKKGWLWFSMLKSCCVWIRNIYEWTPPSEWQKL